MPDAPQERLYALLTYRGADAFLESYNTVGQGHGIYLEGRAELELEQQVDVEIVFSEEVMVFHTRGVVVERQLLPTRERPSGVLLNFLPSEERTRQIIVEYAQGVNRQGVRRRPRRFAVRLDVDYATDMEFTAAVTEDLSKNGAFLLTSEMLDAGTLLAMRLKPPGDSLPIRLNAEVAWRQTEGRKGLGVRFLIGDSSVQDAIDEVLDLLTRDEEPGADG